MTTVTSSDRGDAGSTRSQRSARSKSSDIPGQRAGGAAGAQTLRILVLGGSAAADELRRQAADAGAELAQRFSARVTHVVTEPGIAADDSRVAKALAADLPVLTVDECAQLMGFCAEPAGAVPVADLAAAAVAVAVAAGEPASTGSVTQSGAAGARVGTARIPAQPAAATKKRTVVTTQSAATDYTNSTDSADVDNVRVVGMGAESADVDGLSVGNVSREDKVGEGSGGAGGDGVGDGFGDGDGELRTAAGGSVVEGDARAAGIEEADLGAARESVAEVRLGAAQDSVAEAKPSEAEEPEACEGAGLAEQAGLDEETDQGSEAQPEKDPEAERALYVERVELAQYTSGEADVAVAEESYDSTEQLVEAELTSSFAEVRALAEGREAEREQDRATLGTSVTSVTSVVGEDSSLHSPVEVMLGSALDAALLFPPLPISASESLTFENNYMIDSYADAPVVADSVQTIDRAGSSRGVGRIGQVEDSAYAVRAVAAETAAITAGDVTAGDVAARGTAASDVTAGSVASVGSAADAASGKWNDESTKERAEEQAESKDLGGEADGELIDLLDLNAVGDEEAAARAAERARKVASYAWAAVPFASLGLLTPVSMGYAAYRRRSRALGGVAAWYLFAVGIAFAISAGARGGAKTQSALGDLLTICFAASWIGGTVHSLLIRRQVFGRSE